MVTPLVYLQVVLALAYTTKTLRGSVSEAFVESKQALELSTTPFEAPKFSRGGPDPTRLLGHKSDCGFCRACAYGGFMIPGLVAPCFGIGLKCGAQNFTISVSEACTIPPERSRIPLMV
ncbi:hypothetical protein FOL47_001465 [Perkinsus chesapeaki]|uniref:Uncharacterized protein n=1 Tax=Perkinsus chesapeaki TaxID=330153 RepID=A0A7J6MKM0_PERCH|nr:hypothetical protein FOL47_001465 [Perkinsus chesapeaki]